MPRGPVCWVTSCLAEQLVGGVLDLVLVAAELDAAGLAAAAGMDLRLDHPGLAADLARAVGRLLGAVGEAAARHRHAEARENLLGLIFVNIHPPPPLATRFRTRAECFRPGQPLTGGLPFIFLVRLR